MPAANDLQMSSAASSRKKLVLVIFQTNGQKKPVNYQHKLMSFILEMSNAKTLLKSDKAAKLNAYK